MNVTHPMVVLHSFSIKNIFYEKMDLSLFYFPVVSLSKNNFRRKVFKWKT